MIVKYSLSNNFNSEHLNYQIEASGDLTIDDYLINNSLPDEFKCKIIRRLVVKHIGANLPEDNVCFTISQEV